MKWSRQQERALLAVRNWLADPHGSRCFRLFGFAGAGKTEIARAIGMDTTGAVFAAYTGKAAHVLRQRRCEPVSTIDKLIFEHVYNDKTGLFEPTLKSRDDLPGVRLLIIDEASMIDAELARALLSFGLKVLIIADPMQLPPPVHGGVGYFMKSKPDFLLDEVHRQALHSPILRLANDIRQGRLLWKKGRYGGLLITDGAYSRDGFDYGVVLVGTNDTKATWDRKRRLDLGFIRGFQRFRDPQIGETLVCTCNDYSVQDEIFNGQLWRVHSVESDSFCIRDGRPIPIFNLSLRNDEGRTEVRVQPGCFKEGKVAWTRGLQQFDFGYALTVHKAQGSEWEKVLLVNEARAFPGQSREWLYTGITRASEKLTIVDSY